MARERWVWDRALCDLVPAEDYYARKYEDKGLAPQIMSDLSPYQSVIDRSMIDGRAAHRDHLRANGCVEIGNERIVPRREALSQSDRVSDIKRAMGE